MTDIVERLRELPDCHNLHGRVFRAVREAADEIERLRADLLKAEMRAEIAGLENIMRAVARGRREGIEALAAQFERMTDHATAALVRSVAAALRARMEEGR